MNDDENFGPHEFRQSYPNWCYHEDLINQLNGHFCARAKTMIMLRKLDDLESEVYADLEYNLAGSMLNDLLKNQNQ